MLAEQLNEGIKAGTQLHFSIGVVTSVGLTRRRRQNEALKLWGILIAQAQSGF